MLRMSLIEMLDQWEVKMIVEFLSLYNTLSMRATCSYVRDMTADIIVVLVKKQDRGIGWFLFRSAKKGHRDLCVLARRCFACDTGRTLDLDKILTYAAVGGHRDICELVRGWAGRVEGTQSICGVCIAHAHAPVNAESEKEHIAFPEHSTPPETCETPHSVQLDLDYMLGFAATCTDPIRARDICILAKEWGATNFEWMLDSAARSGYRDLCILARKWLDDAGTKPNFNRTLSCAARCTDHVRARDLCILAKEWLEAEGTKPDFNWMLCNAAEDGHREICELAREWARETQPGSSMDFNEMLGSAAKGGHRGICELAYGWLKAEDIAPNFLMMIGNAISWGHHDICDLACEWRSMWSGRWDAMPAGIPGAGQYR